MIKNKKMRNKAILCPVCGKEFAAKTMANHIKVCYNQRSNRFQSNNTPKTKTDYPKIPADWEGRNYEDINTIINEIEKN